MKSHGQSVNGILQWHSLHQEERDKKESDQLSVNVAIVVVINGLTQKNNFILKKRPFDSLLVFKKYIPQLIFKDFFNGN